MKQIAEQAKQRLFKMTEAGLHNRPKVQGHLVQTDTGFDVVSSAGRLAISKQDALHILTQLRHHAKAGHLRG